MTREDRVRREAARRRPWPKITPGFWYPNYWYEVSPLYCVGRNEALLMELGERTANLGDYQPDPGALRRTGHFGWASEMARAKQRIDGRGSSR